MVEAYAQLEVSQYPVRFSQYYNCFQFINPAYTGSYTKMDITTSDKHLLGNFSKISTYYLAASGRFSTARGQKNSSFSAVGMIVYNDHEGKYINRTRFYATYAWHGSITRKLKFSGGFHIGAMNYAVKGTPLTGDGSDIVPDGAAGLELYSDNFHFGCSYNQLFNNQIQPLEEIANLTPYLNVDGSIKLAFKNKLLLQPSFSSRFPVNSSGYEIDVTLLADFNHLFALAIGIHENNKLMNYFEIGTNNSNGTEYKLGVTYCYPLSKQDIATNFIEISLKLSRF